MSNRHARSLADNQLTRRQFHSRLAAAAAVASLGSAAYAQPAADKLRVVIIGCGGRGAGNMQQMMGEHIVALCDVNDNNLRRAAALVPHAKLFHDFRRLYDELPEGQYDAVVVSTTEHTHAFATLPALQRRKHVYCEKPLTHSIAEARLITEEAKKAGVATQMGTQIHAEPNYRRVVELVQSGVLGAVREVHVWVSRAWGWQSEEEARAHGDIVWSYERPTEEMPVPASLDWELWIGPAPLRPFHEIYFPGPKWYRWWDFGGGTMSDLGSHWIDLPFWALNLDAPISIEASGPPPHAELAPASMSAHYEYGARGDLPPVSVHWYQGTSKPVQWTEGKIPRWDSGVLFVGETASLLADYGRHMLLIANSKLQEFSPFTLPPQSIPNSLGHHAEWIHACKTGEPTTCHFGYSGPLTEANHLGNVAYRAGKKIEWDSHNLRITNAPDAEQFLSRPYREGWTLGDT